MGAIADAIIPDGGATARAPIPGGNLVGGEQPEIDAYQALAPEFSKGLRSSVNSLGGAIHQLVGSVGETMGLTDFARTRFKEAEDYVKFADAVGPRVRDVRAVKDDTDAVDYVAGLSGNIVGGLAPMLAGGAAGAAVRGLRGAAGGAVAGMFPQMAGDQALRTKDAPDTTPAQRLGNALAVGGANTALGVAVPAALAGRAVRGAAPSLARGAAEGAAGQAAAGAAMSKVSQAGHTALAPGRDTSHDTGETINATVAGGAMGAGFGVGAGLASKVPAARSKVASLAAEYAKGKEEARPEAVPEDRPQTTDEVKARVQHEDVPADPSDTSTAPKDASKLAEWSDWYDEHVGKNLTKVWEQVKEHPWAKEFEGFMEDPDKQQSFAEAAKRHWNEVKEKPAVKEVVKKFGEYAEKADKLRRSVTDEGDKPKANQQRTSIDFQIQDAAQEHMPPEKWANLSPMERVRHAYDLKSYVLEQLGQRDPVKGTPVLETKLVEGRDKSSLANTSSNELVAGKKVLRAGDPTSRPVEVPHALQDLYGDRLHPLLDKVYETLKGGGQAMESKVALKKAVDVAGENRRSRASALDDVVGGSMRPEFAGGTPAERTQHVRIVSDWLHKQINEGIDDIPVFNARVKTIFGDNAEHVLESFDRTREHTTRGYETFVEPETEAADARLQAERRLRQKGDEGAFGEDIAPEDRASPQDERSPYRDKRLHQYFDEATQIKHEMDALRATYGDKDVRFKTYPEVTTDEAGNSHLTGRSAIYAEDAAVPQGFSREEIGRIREQQGKAGHENSVVTVVRKGEGTRNETVAVSIPRLMNEVMRTMRQDETPGLEYAKNVLHEGITRLASDPELIGMKNGLDFPPEMKVLKLGDHMYTYGELTKPKLGKSELKLRQIIEDQVDLARAAEDRHEVQDILDRMWARKDMIDERPDTPQKADALERMGKAIKAVYAEKQRREELPKGQDGPLAEQGKGITDIQKELMDPAAEKVAREPRKTTLDDHRGLTGEIKRDPAANTEFEPDGGGPGQKVKDAQLRKNLDTAGSKPKPKPKLSEVRPGKEPLTDEVKAAVRAEIKQQLGDKVGTDFLEKLESGGSGEFKSIGGAERVIISAFAMDPYGVGHHEAMHGLLARMARDNPRVANTLAAAAGSPKIVGQLRKLLAGEPEALRQLVDHEERVAYMYQFWRAGALEMGPKATTIFEHVKQFVTKMLSAWTELSSGEAALPKAERIMEAFHNGRLADRSAAGRVLADILPTEARKEAWSKQMGDWASKVLFTADGYVRSFDNPMITGIADKFMSPPEQQGSPSGYLQVKHVMRNQFLNKYTDIMRGADKERVLQIMQGSVLERDTGNLPSKGPAWKPDSQAVRELRSLLDEMYEYVKKKGVKAVEWDDAKAAYVEHELGKVPDFFPRAYDRAAVEKNYAAFVAVLEKHGYTKKSAEKIIASDKASPNESDSEAGITFYAPESLSRKLRIPDAELAPFMKKDMDSIMYGYIGHMVRRAEYTERFGNQGQKIAEVTGYDVKRKDGSIAHVEGSAEQAGATPEQLRSFGQYVQAMEGTLGHNIDPAMKKFFGAVTTYQNMRLLPLALFSSLVDPLGIAVRGGTVRQAGDAFLRGIRELAKDHADTDRSFARTIGAVSDALDTHMISDAYGQSFSSGMNKWLNDKMFKYNGMESWNNSMRIAASAAAHDFIVRHVQEPGEHSARYLAELGLDKDDVSITKGRLDLTPQVVDALNKWVDGAVLRPHAGVRPIWMSDPRWMLVSHLKQFTYSFQKTIVARVVHEAKNGNVAPLAALSSYVPMIIAADMVRAQVTPGLADNDRQAKWGVVDWFLHGLNRAGITGPGQYALDAARDIGRDSPLPGLTSLGGPAFQQVSDVAKAAMGHTKGGMEREALRALPLVPAMNLR